MNIIYLDVLFLINCITDYLALLCAGKFCGAVLNRIRIGMAAAAGGLYACICMLPDAAWLTDPAIKLCIAVLLCLIAFGSEQKLLRCCVAFLVISAAFGGIISALAQSSGTTPYVPINFKVLLVTFTAAYFVLSLLFHRFDSTRRRQFHTVSVTHMGKTVTFTALKDTGNELFDPISNAPVLVCRQESLAPLFPETDLMQCQTDPYSVFSAISTTNKHAGKLRLIPFQTVSGQGVLVGFKPDKVLIDDKPIQLIVAMTDRPISHDNTYQAIF